MLDLGGMLETIAGLARAGSPGAGLMVHAVASVVIGVLFAALTAGQRSGPGELIFWGTVYGAAWWLLGGLTLLPLLRGEPAGWDLPTVQAATPHCSATWSTGPSQVPCRQPEAVRRRWADRPPGPWQCRESPP